MVAVVTSIGLFAFRSLGAAAALAFTSTRLGNPVVFTKVAQFGGSALWPNELSRSLEVLAIA